MNRTELALLDLVRYRYAFDTKAFDTKVRFLLDPNTHALSETAKEELKSLVPAEVQAEGTS